MFDWRRCSVANVSTCAHPWNGSHAVGMPHEPYCAVSPIPYQCGAQCITCNYNKHLHRIFGPKMFPTSSCQVGYRYISIFGHTFFFLVAFSIISDCIWHVRGGDELDAISTISPQQYRTNLAKQIHWQRLEIDIAPDIVVMSLITLYVYVKSIDKQHTHRAYLTKLFIDFWLLAE